MAYRGIVKLQELRHLLGVSRLFFDSFQDFQARGCTCTSGKEPPKKSLEGVHEQRLVSSGDSIMVSPWKSRECSNPKYYLLKPCDKARCFKYRFSSCKSSVSISKLFCTKAQNAQGSSFCNLSIFESVFGVNVRVV